MMTNFKQSLNLIVLKLLQRASSCKKSCNMISCLLILIVITLLSTLYGSFVVKSIGGSVLQVILPSKPIMSYSQTLDAREPCIKSQWNLTRFYKHNNVSCNPFRLVSILEKGNAFALFEDIGPAWYANCPRISTAAAMQLPSTGLASYPGSGNTWTRHLLHQLTGIQTGAVYISDELLRQGFLGEGKLEKVIAIKTHLTAVQKTQMIDFDRQILILRNPYEAGVAEFKRSHLRAGHTKHVNISFTKEWMKYVRYNIRAWPYFVKVALSFPNLQIIVMYEDMKECLLRELLYIAAFIKTPFLNKFSLCCALTNSQGQNYRNQSPVPMSDLYLRHEIVDMNNMLTTFSKDLERQYPVLAKRLLNYRMKLNN